MDTPRDFSSPPSAIHARNITPLVAQMGRNPGSIFLSYCLADGGSSGGDLVFAVGLLPYGLATDGTNLYWTNYVASGTVATCLLRVA
jgi:hypothetical protein